MPLSPVPDKKCAKPSLWSRTVLRGHQNCESMAAKGKAKLSLEFDPLTADATLGMTFDGLKSMPDVCHGCCVTIRAVDPWLQGEKEQVGPTRNSDLGRDSQAV